MTGPLHQERIAPSDMQVRTARNLLRLVPPASYDWSSENGRRFLDYVEQLAREGVPTRWLANSLGLDPNRLYAILSRNRNNNTKKGAAS